jgi:hypothetical protein
MKANSIAPANAGEHSGRRHDAGYELAANGSMLLISQPPILYSPPSSETMRQRKCDRRNTTTKPASSC